MIKIENNAKPLFDLILLLRYIKVTTIS